MRLPARDGPKASFAARERRSVMLDSLLAPTVEAHSRYMSIHKHHYGPLLLLITSGRRAELAARASASPGSHTVAEAGVRSRCAKRWPLIGGARWPWIQSWWKVWSSAREDARRSRPRRSRSFSWTALPALCPLSSTLNGSQCSARLPPAAFATCLVRLERGGATANSGHRLGRVGSRAGIRLGWPASINCCPLRACTAKGWHRAGAPGRLFEVLGRCRAPCTSRYAFKQ